MNLLQIDNRKGKLKLNDGVHKESADRLIEQLETLYGPAAVAAQMRIGEVVCSADDALESVEVEINSPGGSVFEGQRIYSALREMSSRGVEINTTVNGLAASMGSVILMAGDNRRMTKESRIMIHEPSTVAWGDARTMRKNADLLEGMAQDLADIYASRTGGKQDGIRQLMLAETWMNAAKAKEMGFVSEVIDYGKKDKDAKAEFDTPENGMTGILAKLFPGNTELAQLEASILEADTLRADLATAQARIDELTPLSAEVSNLQSQLSEITAQLETAQARVAELEPQVEIATAKVETRAAEMLAAQGHPAPVSLVGDSEEPTDHLKILATLSGAERTKYYAANGPEIRKQITK